MPVKGVMLRELSVIATASFLYGMECLPLEAKDIASRKEAQCRRRPTCSLQRDCGGEDAVGAVALNAVVAERAQIIAAVADQSSAVVRVAQRTHSSLANGYGDRILLAAENTPSGEETVRRSTR